MFYYYFLSYLGSQLFEKFMIKKISLCAFLILFFAFHSSGIANAESVADLSKALKNKSLSPAEKSILLHKMAEKSIKSGINELAKELDKNIKSIVDDTRGEFKGVIADAKKDLNSVVADAKKEIGSIQGTVQEVKSTIYSVKASFDKIIILLKVLIGLVGVLITLLGVSFFSKIIKILKLTKSVVSIAKGKTEI